MNKTSLVIAFLVAAILAGVFVKFGGVHAPAASSTENFMQKSVGAPLSGPGIGPYDSVSLDGGISGWAASEPHSAAPVGGLPSQAQDGKLMFLVGNKVDPECCPAAVTTDTGCVCLSEQDKNFMGSRAGNRA